MMDNDKITLGDLRDAMLAAFLVGLVFMYVATTIIDAVLAHTASKTEPIHIARPEFGTLPPACGHVYAVGETRAWLDCMLISDRQWRDDI